MWYVTLLYGLYVTQSSHLHITEQCTYVCTVSYYTIYSAVCIVCIYWYQFYTYVPYIHAYVHICLLLIECVKGSKFTKPYLGSWYVLVCMYYNMYYLLSITQHKEHNVTARTNIHIMYDIVILYVHIYYEKFRPALGRLLLYQHFIVYIAHHYSLVHKNVCYHNFKILLII